MTIIVSVYHPHVLSLSPNVLNWHTWFPIHGVSPDSSWLPTHYLRDDHLLLLTASKSVVLSLGCWYKRYIRAIFFFTFQFALHVCCRFFHELPSLKLPSLLSHLTNLNGPRESSGINSGELESSNHLQSQELALRSEVSSSSAFRPPFLPIIRKMNHSKMYFLQVNSWKLIFLIFGFPTSFPPEDSRSESFKKYILKFNSWKRMIFDHHHVRNDHALISVSRGRRTSSSSFTIITYLQRASHESTTIKLI